MPGQFGSAIRRRDSRRDAGTDARTVWQRHKTDAKTDAGSGN